MSLTRRRFITSASATAAATVLIPDVVGGEIAFAAKKAGRFRDGSFPGGVLSGDPEPNAITLLTRIDDVMGAGTVGLEVATDSGFRKVVARREIPTSGLRGHSAKARVTGLKPYEDYYYRFSTRTTTSRVGRTRTALPPDSEQPVRFAFFSCQDFESGFYTAHAGIAQEDDLDLVICLGDYIYEKSYDPSKTRTDKTGANGDAEVQTLAEYRDKYRLYHTDPDLLAMRAQHPMYALWDDHEVEDNYASGLPGDATENRRIGFAERRAAGYRAFFEHQPQLPIDGADRIYGTIALGRNADVLLLDQRQYRSDQPCSDATAPPPGTCADKDDPSRTMLGPAQKAWFKDALAGSKARWKLVGNELQMMSLDLTRGNPLTVDSWDGYAAERRELGEFIRDRGIKDVSFLTGDIHTFFAGNVTPSGREGPGQPAAVATEFVGGSITSEGIGDRQGRQGSVDLSEQIALALDGGTASQNPQIKYSNQSRKGYGVLQASATELLVQYKSPATVVAPKSAITTLQRFRVASGTANVEVLGPG